MIVGVTQMKAEDLQANPFKLPHNRNLKTKSFIKISVFTL